MIEEYVSEGPRRDELEDERQSWAGGYTVGLATNVGVARELVKVLAAGESVSRMDDFPRQLLNLGGDEVLRAVRRHIHPERLVMVAAGTAE
ncbi:MAG: hypothetical protein K8R59_13255 [Thermoanaerobaculales bacterium]|nr:hypothetical protein [Thermoanaerobaculales bacterium]